MNASPLSGVRVLDFGQGVAGPYCAQLLGDHGADVIKIEPPRGDWSRTMGAEGGVYASVNRNKRGACLDLRDDEVRDLVRSLAVTVDVVVESFRPGVMERFGLGSETLRAAHPGLVYCSVTGFGSSGPNVDLPAGDSTMQAYGGLMSIVGEREGGPLRVGNVVSDMLAGTNAFSGVLLALLARAKEGRGRHVEVSLLDSIVAFQAPPLSEFLLTGEPPRRLGNDHPLIAPSGTVRAKDGLLTLTVFDHQWERFCEAMGLPELARDERFLSSAARQRHRDALNAALAPLFLRREKAQWIAELRRMDVLCAPVNEYPDLVADPQVRHNELLGSLRDARGRDVPSIRNPVRLERGERRPLAPPLLGEHTCEILQSACGCSAAQLDRLVARGAAFAAEPAPALPA